MNKIVIIGGHTASGKTELGIEIAELLKTDIICADSMLVYKRMNIGTAKPDMEEQKRIKHHMIDIIEPWETFTVSDYCDMAIKHITEKTLIAGGTGFYINAIINGTYKAPASIPEIRKRLIDRLKTGESLATLHKELQDVDPQSAKRIHPNDSYRILRALEVYLCTGKTMSYFREQHSESNTGINPQNILFTVLRIEKEELKNRIIKRTEKMISSGLVEEVKELLANGCTADTKSMKSIGYHQIVSYLQSKTSLEDAKNSIISETLDLAKRQNTWFKGRKNTRFYDPLNGKADLMNDIKKFMGL